MVEVSVTVSLNEGVFICEISGWGQSAGNFAIGHIYWRNP